MFVIILSIIMTVFIILMAINALMGKDDRTVIYFIIFCCIVCGLYATMLISKLI